MAYEQRDEFPGLFHVTIRGNNKRDIFVDDYDRLHLLRRLSHTGRRHGWQFYAYCLMRNHYHLVLEIGERGMSRGFCELHTGYAWDFNQRHGRLNHLFGRRYWSDRIEGDRHFLGACRYVLQNPVRAGLVPHPGDWRWSSYASLVGLAFAELPIARDDVLAQFSRRRGTAIERAEEFFATPGSWRPVRWQPPSRNARGSVT